jgi:hypothetical protein
MEIASLFTATVRPTVLPHRPLLELQDMFVSRGIIQAIHFK